MEFDPNFGFAVVAVSITVGIILATISRGQLFGSRSKE